MTSSYPRPQVILLDAVGTLFGVQGSVGQIYSDLAYQFGVDVDADVLNQTFFKSFREAPPMAFPGVETAEIPKREYAWWEEVARQTYNQAGVLEQFSNFSEFFSALYAYFATGHPWVVYPEIQETLTAWRELGIELGILSNFDSRIHGVLEALSLSKFFSSVTISTEVGVAKPDPQVFKIALEKHHCPPKSAWHVGDSFREDYKGAQAAGLRAIWLRRHEPLAVG